MKVTTGKLSKRIKFTDNRTYGILNYDTDNLYPQNIDMIISGSGTASSCVGVFAKFVRGAGFIDEAVGDFVLRDFGYEKITMNGLLGDIALDFAKFDGFAIHVNYNGKYEVIDVSHVPFSYCRLTTPDSELYVGHIAVYDNWDKSRPRKIEHKKIDYINRFNPDPEVIRKQVARAGGWRNYKGQILWVSRAGIHRYPKTMFDPVLEDIETDSMIKTAKYKGIMNNFSAGHMFVHRGKFDSEKERQAFTDNLTKFMGVENQSSLFLVELEFDEQEPELKAFESNEHDKTFSYHEKSIQDNIRKQAQIPPVLLGDLIVGRLGTAEEIYDATELFNIYTLDERRYITMKLGLIMDKFKGFAGGSLEIDALKIFTEEDILKRTTTVDTTKKEEGNGSDN